MIMIITIYSKALLYFRRKVTHNGSITEFKTICNSPQNIFYHKNFPDKSRSTLFWNVEYHSINFLLIYQFTSYSVLILRMMVVSLQRLIHRGEQAKKVEQLNARFEQMVISVDRQRLWRYGKHSWRLPLNNHLELFECEHLELTHFPLVDLNLRTAHLCIYKVLLS